MGTTVFRNYDQKSLDWWYNARGLCGETEKLKAAQENGSNMCRQKYRSELNIKHPYSVSTQPNVIYPN